VREIDGGTLKENDPILSERLLTEQFHISRISVRKAIKELIEENYLYTVPGKGTFVKGLTHELEKPAKRTYNLGYIFWGEQKSLTHIPYFAHIVAGAEKETHRHNYHLLISTYRGRGGRRISLPPVVKLGKVDGILLEGVETDAYRQINKVIPAVVLSNFIFRGEAAEESTEDIDYVAANNEVAVHNVLEYLKKLGHRNIGFLYETRKHSTFNERLNGFITGVEKFHLHSRKEWIVKAANGGEGIREILKLSKRPTAIVAANDKFALDVIGYCSTRGISIPRTFSLVGFDDIEGAAWSRPALSTVRVFTEEMGRLAARRLIERIEDPASPLTHILIGTKMIIRDSCAKISSPPARAGS
jgi:DNA-binding LacI/PurR family transcriptional regulator